MVVVVVAAHRSLWWLWCIGRDGGGIRGSKTLSFSNPSLRGAMVRARPVKGHGLGVHRQTSLPGAYLWPVLLLLLSRFLTLSLSLSPPPNLLP